MATHAGGLSQDQNINVDYNGTLLGGKTISTTSSQKKGGGFGIRKPLNDLSNRTPHLNEGKNQRKFSVLTTKNHNSMNEGDCSDSKSVLSVAGMANKSKVLQKAQTGGRKPLGDLTNFGTGVPHVHNPAPKNSRNKLSTVAEEQFLHNHEECIRAQKKAIDMDLFLKTVGLDKDVSMQLPSITAPLSLKVKRGSPERSLEMEEMLEFLKEEVQSPPQCAKHERFLHEHVFIPTPCGSPKSPKSCMLLEDYDFSDFVLAPTP